MKAELSFRHSAMAMTRVTVLMNAVNVWDGSINKAEDTFVINFDALEFNEMKIYWFGQDGGQLEFAKLVIDGVDMQHAILDTKFYPMFDTAYRKEHNPPEFYQPGTVMYNNGYMQFDFGANPTRTYLRFLEGYPAPEAAWDSKKYGADTASISWIQDPEMKHKYPKDVLYSMHDTTYNRSYLLDKPYTADTPFVPVGYSLDFVEIAEILAEVQSLYEQHGSEFLHKYDRPYSVFESILYRKPVPQHLDKFLDMKKDATKTHQDICDLNYRWTYPDTKLQECLERIPFITRFNEVSIIRFAPGSFLAHHKDIFNPKRSHFSHNQVYIPLNIVEGRNWFKFFNVGDVPLKNGQPFFTNTFDYLHLGANDNTEARYSIIFSCAVDTELLEEYT